MTALVAQEPHNMTIEEYLEMEERSGIKHTYIKGQIIPMPGGTLKHNRISLNIAYAIERAIRQQSLPYIVSNSDTKIWIPAIEAFYYPDAVVIFEIPEFYKGRKDIILNPLLIVEVSSPSTEAQDRGSKFFDYATLPSFVEYLILQQNNHLAQHSNRIGSDNWQQRNVEGIDQEIELKSIGCTITMRDIYNKTENL
jgi:Uma2 family endonuclease